MVFGTKVLKWWVLGPSGLGSRWIVNSIQPGIRDLGCFLEAQYLCIELLFLGPYTVDLLQTTQEPSALVTGLLGSDGLWFRAHQALAAQLCSRQKTLCIIPVFILGMLTFIWRGY